MRGGETGIRSQLPLTRFPACAAAPRLGAMFSRGDNVPRYVAKSGDDLTVLSRYREGSLADDRRAIWANQTHGRTAGRLNKNSPARGLFLSQARIAGFYLPARFFLLGCPIRGYPRSAAAAPAWSIAVIITGHAHMTRRIKVGLRIVA